MVLGDRYVETKRVEPDGRRIQAVLIEVCSSSRKLDRVLGDEALEDRAVIAAAVLVEVITDLAVVLAAGELVGVGAGVVEDWSAGIAEGLVLILVLDRAVAVSQGQGGPQGVGQVAERTAATRLGSLEVLVNVGPGQHGGADRIAAG